MTSDSTSLLSARGLTAALDVGGESTRVLDDIALDVAPGEVVDVVGPSGSGKTTLLRALAQLLPGAEGRLALDGRSSTEFTAQEWRRDVALLPQKPAIVPGTVRENLLLPWRFKVRHGAGAVPADATLRESLNDVGLARVELDREAARLSVGQHARLAFVRTLLTEPCVLLLDEADASLDDDSAALVAARVSAFAREGRRAVVRVRHRGDDGIAARRLRLEHGRLTQAEAAR